MKAWMRILKVTLTSTKLKRQLVFGANEETKNTEDLEISVTGHKYMSTLKDDCVIKITNLTYSQIVQIIDGQYYDVTVEAGYRSCGSRVIFDGALAYISNSLDDEKTNTAILLCASKAVAKFGQSRLNLTLNSGINMFSAINFLTKANGMKTVTISEQLKKNFLEDKTSVKGSATSWLDAFCTENSNYIVNSDSSTGSILSIYDANRSNLRVIDLSNANSILVGGYPQLTEDGLQLSIMPTVMLMCGDTIKIDNSLISIPVNSRDEIEKNYGYYLDKNGLYTIYEMDYALQNHGASFSINILAKTRSLISNWTGGSNS